MEVGTNLTKALLSVQKSLETVAKSGMNPHLKTTYATLPDVLEELLPKCHEAGILVLQRTLDGESVGILRLETLVIHAESGELLTMITPMPVPQTSAQAYGSALTYARRYALMSLFGMKAEDDDAHNATQTQYMEQRPQTAPAPPAPARPQPYQNNYQAAPARTANTYARNGGSYNGNSDGRDYEEMPVAAPTRPAPATNSSHNNAGSTNGNSTFEALPTDRQMDTLAQLGYDGASPQTRAEASQIISRLKAQRTL